MGPGSILGILRISAHPAFAGLMLVQVFCLAEGFEAWAALPTPLAFAASAVLFVAPVSASIMAATVAITVLDWHWLYAAAMPVLTAICWSRYRPFGEYA